jgi:type III restriction enzyme
MQRARVHPIHVTKSPTVVLAVQREMIRRTIREHLDKEKRLRPLGIKVLSLFFIDEVSRYRRYTQAGTAEKGDYARIFEEEYRRAVRPFWARSASR